MIKQNVYDDLAKFKSLSKMIKYFIEKYCIYIQKHLVLINSEDIGSFMKIFLDRVNLSSKNIFIEYEPITFTYHMTLRMSNNKEYRLILCKYKNNREKLNYIGYFRCDDISVPVIQCIDNYRYTYQEMLNDQDDVVQAALTLIGVAGEKPC